MNTWLTPVGRALAIIIPIILGLLTIIYSGTLKSDATSKDTLRPPLPVRVLIIEDMQVKPRATGYGLVAPAFEWRAVARVEGEVIETSPLLAKGSIAEEGAVLLRIDETDLRLELAQIDAQLAALDVKDLTLANSAALARADLVLSQKELDRQKDLKARGVATQTALDQSLRAELAARAKQVELENQVSLNQAERDVLITQRASTERSLEFTVIKAPFEVRIGDVNADLGQYVSRGAELFSADGTAASEVTAQFQIGRISPMIRSLGDQASVIDLSAVVRLKHAGSIVEWPARVAQVSDSIDARTQSANIIIRVDNSQTQAQAGRRPPLRRGMFVEVTLSAPSRSAIVIPTSAIQDGNQVLVVNQANALEQRQIEIQYTFEGLAIIEKGLAAGDKVVVTDPAIAIPGMPVKAIEDKNLKISLSAIASARDTQP